MKKHLMLFVFCSFFYLSNSTKAQNGNNRIPIESGIQDDGMSYYATYGDAKNIYLSYPSKWYAEHSIPCEKFVIQRFKGIYLTKVKESKNKISVKVMKNNESIMEEINTPEKLTTLINRFKDNKIINLIRLEFSSKNNPEYFFPELDHSIFSTINSGEYLYLYNHLWESTMSNLDFQINNVHVNKLREIFSEKDVLYCIPKELFTGRIRLFYNNNNNSINLLRDDRSWLAPYGHQISQIVKINSSIFFNANKLSNHFLNEYLMCILGNDELFNNIELQSALYKAYHEEFNYEQKKLYLNYINRIGETNKVIDGYIYFCKSNDYCKPQWFWLSLIHKESNIPIQYITRFMIAQAPKFISDTGHRKDIVTYLETNDILDNEKKAFELIYKLSRNLIESSDPAVVSKDVYKVTGFAELLKYPYIKSKLGSKNFEYFSLKTEDVFLKYLYSMRKQGEHEQYLIKHSEIFLTTFPNSKNIEMVKDIRNLTLERYVEYNKQTDKFVRKFFATHEVSTSNGCDEMFIPNIQREGTFEERWSLGDGEHYSKSIEFTDGVKGIVFLGKASSRYFISDGFVNHYYKSYKSAINALYLYKKCNYFSEIDRL